MSATTAPIQHCDSMADVRRHIDALDARIVPLLAERGAYVAQAARIKQDAGQIFDGPRIEFIVERVRAAAREENIAVLNKPVKPASLRALLGQWRTQQMVAAE